MLVPVTEAEIAGASNLHFFFAIYPNKYFISEPCTIGGSMFTVKVFPFGHQVPKMNRKHNINV